MGCAIRPEMPDDHAAVYEVNRLAFGQDNEAELVNRLRQSPDHVPELSLVATVAGEVVGHILFSRITIETAHGSAPTLILAPMAVHPDHQNRGVGSALVREGLQACKRLGHTSVLVVGHPDYYPRFGFRRASQFGIAPAFAAPDEAFLAIELVPGALAPTPGIVHLPPEFAGL
jgi:putative acetyltransferase